MLKKSISLVLSIILLVLPGCVKYYDVIKSEFPQAEEHKDYREIVHNYVKSKHVYHEFITEAMFDVLWLSSETRRAYVNRLSIKQGKSETARNAILKRQLEENKHWISFYVLADVRTRTYATMSDDNSYWSVYLVREDGQKIEPEHFKEVELEPVYKSFFSHRHNQFKTAYEIKFPVNDVNNNPHFASGEVVTMVISSPDRHVKFVWDKKDFKKASDLLPDDDFYWAT